MPTLQKDILAYFDSYSGLVPCKVLRVYHEMNTNAVDVKVTASHGPYERNEQLKFLRTSCVVPRNAVHVRNGQYKIWSYDIKFD